MFDSRRLAVPLTLALCLVLQSLDLAAQDVDNQDLSPPDATVHEAIDVVEVSVLVEFTDLDAKDIESLTAADLVVREGGIPRTVTRIASLNQRSRAARRASGGSASSDDDSVEPWRILIYFDDQVRDSPLFDSRDRSLSALAERAATLAALGSVSIERASQQRPLLSDSRSVLEIEKALLELKDDLSRESPPDPPPRVASDRLLLSATRCPYAPCLLIWLSDGSAAASPDGLADETARVLAAHGWTVLAVALREAAPGPSFDVAGAGTDYDAWKRESGGVQMAQRHERKSRIDRSAPESHELLVLPRFEMHRRFIAATAGGAARLDWQLDEEVERLGRRWWLLFQRPVADDPRLPESGSAPFEVQFAPETVSAFEKNRALQVRLGFAKPELTIRAPRFTRLGALKEISAALLRSPAEGLSWMAPRVLAVSEQDRFLVSGFGRDQNLHQVRLSGVDEGPRKLTREDLEQLGLVLTPDSRLLIERLSASEAVLERWYFRP
jgi:hypothetical protein